MVKQPNWQPLVTADGIEGEWAIENGVVMVMYRDSGPASTHSSGPGVDQQIAKRMLRELAAAYKG